MWFTFLQEQAHLRKVRETKSVLDAFSGQQPELPKAGASQQSEYEAYVLTYKATTWKTYQQRLQELAEKGTLVDYSSATGYRSGVFYLSQQMKTQDRKTREKEQYIKQLEKQRKKSRFSSIFGVFSDKEPESKSQSEVAYFNEMQRKKENMDNQIDKLKETTDNKPFHVRLLEEIKFSLQSPKHPILQVLRLY